MHWAWDIVVPAGTGEWSPVTEILKLSKGVITRIDVKFPAGCHGMVKVRILREEAQLVPLSRKEWLIGDDETVPTESYYELSSSPYQLKFVGCSPGTRFDHMITVRVAITPLEVASSKPLLEIWRRLAKRILGE